MDRKVRHYMSTIGRRGGQKSRRSLSSEDARTMVKVREARRAFKHFHLQCFWSSDPSYKIKKEDLRWVSKELMKHGDQSAWKIGSNLCH